MGINISGLTALGGAPATGDLIPVVDISDTTQAATGTTKYITVVQLFTSPTFITPALGTPASGTLTNCTIPVGGVTGLGTGVGAALAVNVGSAGAPVLFNGAGGTPSSLVLTNATGSPALTAPTATTLVATTQVRTSGNGDTTTVALGLGSGTNLGFNRNGSTGYINVILAGKDLSMMFDGNYGTFLRSDFGFGISSAAPLVNGSAPDVIWTRRGAAQWQAGLADAASPVAQSIYSQGGSGTDKTGAAFTFVPSLGTGSGTSGNWVVKTGIPLATGTTQHTPVERHVIAGKPITLTDNTATSIFEVALPTLKMCGGVILATVQVTDGVDMQSFTQTVTYSAVNKGGSYTKSITASTGDKSVSAGTLTTTWTLLDGTNKVTVQLAADTSLTPSGTNSFVVYYQVFNNSEQAITTL